MNCPLCSSEDISLYFESENKQLKEQTPQGQQLKENERPFFQCGQCFLVFVPAEYHCSSGEEKERYLLHQNSAEDKGYIDFLSRIIDPVLDAIDKNSPTVKTIKGLDFGSGPEPVLAELFRRRGYLTDIYDPFFAPDISLEGKKYDFICSTEVVEHFCLPGKEFALLDEILNRPGVLAVMTRPLPDKKDFPGWFYKDDFTHIVFYSKETMIFIAGYFGWDIEIIKPDIFLFRKS